MVVEEKDETVNEETSNSETEKETIDSASDVVTSPTVETVPNDDKYVQLEQRITSLEQRFNGQEQQQQQQQQEQPQPQEDTSSNEQSDNDDSDNSDGMESDEEIKKILGL